MVFDKTYSDFYDLFYQEKDYSHECDIIEKIFKENHLSPKTILDLGCGTGGHALPLSKRGYKITGVDRSIQMLEIAKKKAKTMELSIQYFEQNINSLQLNSTFDVVISMFAVIGYQTSNDSLEKTFRNVREHLKPGGIFIFDCWYGPTVLKEGPQTRVKTLKKEEEIRIIRLASPSLDEFNHVVNINYHLLEIKRTQILSEIKETHTMRFFFAQELRYFLEKAGFKQIHFYPFSTLDRKLSPLDWNMLVTAGNYRTFSNSTDY